MFAIIKSTPPAKLLNRQPNYPNRIVGTVRTDCSTDVVIRRERVSTEILKFLTCSIVYRLKTAIQ